MDSLRLNMLLGFPRSGTTWASNLLKAHPETVYRHESIGRTISMSLPPDLYARIKAGAALTTEQERRVAGEILRADPVHDRAPFFAKHYTAMARYPRIRWAVWLAASRSGLAERLYQSLYSPPPDRQRIVLLKETRSSKNMGSILRSLRPELVIHLIRNADAVVASHLSGYESGSMRRPSADERAAWYANHADRRSVSDLGLKADDIRRMSEAQYTALRWRVWNEELLEIGEHQVCLRLFYDKLFQDTELETGRLLAAMGLELHPQVLAFISKSKSASHPPVVGRDAGTRYYSVYRGKRFDPNRATHELPESTKREIAEVIAGSPVVEWSRSGVNPTG